MQTVAWRLDYEGRRKVDLMLCAQSVKRGNAVSSSGLAVCIDYKQAMSANRKRRKTVRRGFPLHSNGKLTVTSRLLPGRYTWRFVWIAWKDAKATTCQRQRRIFVR
jgi:hypothetical protein